MSFGMPKTFGFCAYVTNLCFIPKYGFVETPSCGIRQQTYTTTSMLFVEHFYRALNIKLVSYKLYSPLRVKLNHNKKEKIYDASSWSIICLKTLYGCAPTIWIPFMKNDGVPETPSELPSLKSFKTADAYFPVSRHELKFS